METEEKKALHFGSGCVMLLLIVMELAAGFILMKGDMWPAFRWWLMLLLASLAAHPFCLRLFGGANDGSWLLGKLLGVLLPAWLMWLLSSLHILRFSTSAVVIVTLLCWIAMELCAIGRPIELKAEAILPRELVFTTAYMLFCYIKCFNPDAFGTERMMDYGFMQSLYRSAYFPPQDLWFAGESLNYYYFGQYVCSFLCRLSFTEVAYGYNLALCMCFGLCAGFAYSLLSWWMQGRGAAGSVAVLAGGFGALALCCSASLHYLIFRFLVPWLWDILAIPGEKPSYWYADSTRYIGYHPETGDRTAHEFPAYSFLLGDLHAHVINIFVVLSILTLLYAYVRQEREEVLPLRRYLTDPKLYLLGFLLGICMMENFWDFPIYFVVSGAVLLALHLRSRMPVYRLVQLIALQAFVVLGMAFLCSLPFQLHFHAMADGIMRAEAHTPLYQLAILWGLPLVLLGVFLAALVKESSGKGFRTRLRSLSGTDLYVLLLGLCGAGLILIPELVYVADIYSGDFKRFNTMFKLSYQAYILLTLVMVYIILRFVLQPSSARQRGHGLRGGILLILCCGYFLTALYMSAGDILDYAAYKGLRADRYLLRECVQDADAVYWARDNISDGSVLLEANGSSYTIYNRASVISGLPTVLGWHTHEWLWHNALEPVDARAAAVERMYVDADAQLMRQYGVDYVFIGSCEYEKYADLGMNLPALLALGEAVYIGSLPDEEGRVSYIIRLYD